LSPESLAGLITEIKATGLNKLRAPRGLCRKCWTVLSAKEAIDKLGIKVVGDESQLLELVRKAIAANPKAVADFKEGQGQSRRRDSRASSCRDEGDGERRRSCNNS